MRGIPCSPGVAVGPAWVVAPVPRSAEPAATTGGPSAAAGEGSDPVRELARLREAVARVGEVVGWLRERVAVQAGAEAAGIFEAHALILEDPELWAALEETLREGKTAARAVEEVFAAYGARLAALEDPYLAGRAADLQDLASQVLAELSGRREPAIRLDRPSIVVARELTPSQTAGLDAEFVLGICTAGGGPTSHAAILARSLGIPAVVGLSEELLDRVRPGVEVLLDGSTGEVMVSPPPERVAWARREMARGRRAVAPDPAPARTREGRRVEVGANVGGLEEACLAFSLGADGLGLVRTEFLFQNREQPPSEEEQYLVYRDLVEVAGGRPVLLRTLDVGGDKPLRYLDLPAEANPFLGERGLRLCLARPEVWRDQIRAAIRAAVHGQLWLLVPMVTTAAEAAAARALVAAQAAELGLAVPRVGFMLEVPGAVLSLEALAPHADFFSLGTNDLAQYTMAADRTHPRVAPLADALQPAVLFLVREAVRRARAAGRWLGVCGEAAGDPEAVPLLVGLGVDELSVAPRLVPVVKAAVRGLDAGRAARLAHSCLRLPDAAAVRAAVRAWAGGGDGKAAGGAAPPSVAGSPEELG